MLERAAGCLEIGGQRLMRAPRKAIGRRRLLHSAFWCHGAGDIDLPSWWISLLQLPPTKDGAHAEGTSRVGRDWFSGDSDSSLFEFLYPAKTLALIQRYSTHSADGKWRRQRAKNGVRSYTSRAVEARDQGRQAEQASAISPTGEFERLQESNQGLQDGSVEVSTDNTAFQTLRDDLMSGKRRQYEDAWQSYQKLRYNEQEEQAVGNSKFLIEYLSTSSRKIDAQRIIDLFHRLDFQHRDSRDYRATIMAHISLSKLVEAAEIHDEALFTVTGDFGSSALLANAIASGDWVVAFRTWKGYRQHMGNSDGIQGIWAEVDLLPSLADQASSLAESLETDSEGNPVEMDPDARADLTIFVNNVMFRVLEFESENFTMDHIHAVFDRLRSSQLLTSAHYENAIFKLLGLGRGKFASTVYQDYRQQEGSKPGRRVLYALLVNFSKVDSIRGIKMVLDDLFANHKGPDIKGFDLALRKLASAGDANAVHQLLRDCVSKYGPPSNPKLLNHLLLVHSRRAEVDETVRQFKRLSEEFHVTPDLRSWNILLSVHARVKDVDGTFRYFSELLDTKISPDKYTYGILTGLCASRGDITGLQEILRMMASSGIKRSATAVDGLVLAYINNDELDEAEDFVEAALTMDLEGTRTRMWNYLLNAHALRRNIDNVVRIHQRMQQAEVPLDGMTYAALMQGLTIIGESDAAWKILRVVMPRDGIKVTAFHYAIVMGGYVGTKELEKVVTVYQRMIKRNIQPTLSTQISLLKASINSEVDENRKPGFESAVQEFNQSEALLEETLAMLDPMELATKQPVRGIGKQPLDDAYLAAPFDYLIFVYGQYGLFEKVEKLYDKYITTSTEGGLKARITPSSKLLSALMVSHLRQKQYDDVHKCWNLVKSSTERISKRLDAADTSRPRWVLPSRRYLLTTPLMYELKALGEQRDVAGLASTITSLQSDGYQLDGRNWNLYIQILIRNDQTFLAFELCERHLMAGWTGWPFQQSQYGTSRAVAKASMHHRLRPWVLSPNYRTLVFLMAAVMDLQSAEAGSLRLRGVGSESQRIEKVAPRTMEAVRNMPRIDDHLQTEWLRRW